MEEVAELCVKSGMEAYTVLGAINGCVYEVYREMRKKGTNTV